VAQAIYVDCEQRQHVVEVSSGVTLMQAAVDNSVPGIYGDCGGSASCGTCHVYVAPDWIERAGAACTVETDLLEGLLHTQQGSRLSCQIAMCDRLDGIVVQIAPSQW